MNAHRVVTTQVVFKFATLRDLDAIMSRIIDETKGKYVDLVYQKPGIATKENPLGLGHIGYVESYRVENIFD